MPAPGRVLLGSWALEGLGWFALGEAYMRILAEGALGLALLLLGWNLLAVVAALLVAHTILWFLLYGGYAKLSSLAGRRRPLPRLLEFRARIEERVRHSSHFRAGLLYGSSGRGTMNEQSDVDLMVVPAGPFPRGILALWAMRAVSTLQRMPLEANSLDLERHLLFRGHGPGTIRIKATPRLHATLGRGALVSFSGVDGSGKTTVAKALMERSAKEGIRTQYFYGHRQYFRQGERNLSAAIVFKGVWRHIGRSLTDFRDHPRAALVLDFLTLADYVFVQLRLSRLLKPGTLVFADRYVPDVIAYLRSLGPPRQSVEGLLAGVSFPADLALLFDVDAAVAYARKREEDEDSLRGYEKEYAALAEQLGLTRIDASASSTEVTAQALETIRTAIDLAQG